MNEFVNKLYDFMGIYKKIRVEITIGLSKNHFNLILTVGFYFDSNLIVGSSYIRWKSI